MSLTIYNYSNKYFFFAFIIKYTNIIIIIFLTELLNEYNQTLAERGKIPLAGTFSGTT